MEEINKREFQFYDRKICVTEYEKELDEYKSIFVIRIESDNKTNYMKYGAFEKVDCYDVFDEKYEVSSLYEANKEFDRYCILVENKLNKYFSLQIKLLELWEFVSSRIYLNKEMKIRFKDNTKRIIYMELITNRVVAKFDFPTRNERYHNGDIHFEIPNKYWEYSTTTLHDIDSIISWIDSYIEQNK